MNNDEEYMNNDEDAILRLRHYSYNFENDIYYNHMVLY